MLTSLVSQVSINYLFYKRWPEVTKLLSKEALIDGYDFKIREDRNKIQEIQQVSLWSIGSWWSIKKNIADRNYFCCYFYILRRLFNRTKTATVFTEKLNPTNSLSLNLNRHTLAVVYSDRPTTIKLSPNCLTGKEGKTTVLLVRSSKQYLKL